MAERYSNTVRVPRVVALKDDQAEPLSADELAQIQATVERLSRWMDSIFELPVLGWRFGFDALIGLIPGLGDAATTFVSLYILTFASRLGLPKITLARMGLNVALDFVLGALPLVGDVFDVWWKANQRNAALLRERLADSDFQSRRATTADWLFVGGLLLLLLAMFAGVVVLTVFMVSLVWHAAASLFSSGR